eukprot:EG_transcript_46919
MPYSVLPGDSVTRVPSGSLCSIHFPIPFVFTAHTRARLMYFYVWRLLNPCIPLLSRLQTAVLYELCLATGCSVAGLYFHPLQRPVLTEQVTVQTAGWKLFLA